MNGEPTRTQLLLVRLVLVLSLVFVVVGLAMHGFSGDALARIWQNLLERPDGPLVFRFILQPAMASLAAVRDGIHDARAGRTPFLWTAVTRPAERAGRLHEALVATARVILLGLAMDTVYQLIAFQSFHPVEAVLMAFLLGLVPYLLLRGVVTRVARRWVGTAPDGRPR